MKKIIAIILALFLLAGCAPQDAAPSTSDTVATEQTAPQETWQDTYSDYSITAQQYFVYQCESGSFLYNSGELSEKIYPASVTKLFTAYVAMQFLPADRQITAGDALNMVAAGSSVADLKKGNTYTVRQLVEAMLLPSGNDAAYVLAVEAGRLLKGSKLEAKAAAKAFVDEMNAQAKLLGMTGTHFANPDGIHSEDHYTTFADLAILATVSMEDPTIMRYAATAADGTWKNTNALVDPQSMYYCPYCVGLKTGQTPYAGSCLLSAFEYRGQTIVVGVFGCPQEEDRFTDTLCLFGKATAQIG